MCVSSLMSFVGRNVASDRGSASGRPFAVVQESVAPEGNSILERVDVVFAVGAPKTGTTDAATTATSEKTRIV
jgi:hypothetical protein